MISASHNEIEDNGFKVINEEGEMLDECFEFILSEYVNIDSELI